MDNKYLIFLLFISFIFSPYFLFFYFSLSLSFHLLSLSPPHSLTFLSLSLIHSLSPLLQNTHTTEHSLFLPLICQNRVRNEKSSSISTLFSPLSFYLIISLFFFEFSQIWCEKEEEEEEERKEEKIEWI